MNINALYNIGNNIPIKKELNHKDCIEIYKNNEFDFSEVSPIFNHHYMYNDKPSNTITTSRNILQEDNREYIKTEYIYLKQKLDKCILKENQFMNYIKNEYSYIVDYIDTFKPDLWFDTLCKNDFNRNCLGIIEIVKCSDIDSIKKDKLLNLADMIDYYYPDTWVCILKKHIESQWFECIYLF